MNGNKCCNCGEEFFTHRDLAEKEFQDEDVEAYYITGRVRCNCEHGCHAWSRDDIPGFRESSAQPCCNGLCPCVPSPVHSYVVCSIPEGINRRQWALKFKPMT